jgi:hypothetical protein
MSNPEQVRQSAVDAIMARSDLSREEVNTLLDVVVNARPNPTDAQLDAVWTVISDVINLRRGGPYLHFNAVQGRQVAEVAVKTVRQVLDGKPDSKPASEINADGGKESSHET